MSSEWKSKISSLMSDHKFLLSHSWRLLIWEKPFFPIITFLSVTIFFWIIAMSKASVITTFAIIGILITFIDFIGPTVYPSLVPQFGSQSESDYEAACGYLALPFKLIAKGIDKLIELKQRQKAILSGAVAGVLLLSSLLGRVNNYYLCYLASVIFLMAPGALKKAGINIDDSSSSGRSGSISSPGGYGGTTTTGYGSSSPYAGGSSFSPSTSSTPIKPSSGTGSTIGDDAKTKSNDDDD